VAKVSVSIPDDLLARARALHESASTSQLVQRGLEQLTAHVTESSESGYARRPEDAEDLLAAARDKLLAKAQAKYEEGYHAGMEDAGDLPLGLLEALADARFDLIAKLSFWQRSWAPAAGNEHNPPDWFDVLADRFGRLVDPVGYDEFNFAPPRTFVRGYAAALRDVWATIEPEQDVDSTGPGTGAVNKE
jgi:hypothetical protein